MPQAEVFSPKGEKVGEIGLSEALFGREPNKGLIRAAVLAHLNASRVGTAKAKTRSEVRGGGRKPWRQKGLGRARAGTITSPIWRHGGVAFGPHPRDYSWDLPKKVRRLALKSALSAKAKNGQITVLTGLTMAAPKTKDLYAFLKKMGVHESVLIVTGDNEPNVVLSARNIPGARVTTARELSTYETMLKKHILITEDAVRKLEEALT
ncbi:MAG: 50S ribosomal protein L4 [Bacillota bacterium]|nr:50S ribosomal protein L4 [Candidatus Fermentithermobacillaceae bacterium]